MTGTTIEERTAPAPDLPISGPVTLMNRFMVPAERDEAFYSLWSKTSEYFKAQPGFVSLRLHRALSADAEHRWVNVATWATESDFRAAHSTPEFRDVVTQPGWQEFPSAPMLFEVVTSAG